MCDYIIRKPTITATSTPKKGKADDTTGHYCDCWVNQRESFSSVDYREESTPAGTALQILLLKKVFRHQTRSLHTQVEYQTFWYFGAVK